MDDDDEMNGGPCFGCSTDITIALETFVTEPCPDVLGNVHAWHIQCWMCFKMHGAFPNKQPCQPEDVEP